MRPLLFVLTAFLLAGCTSAPAPSPSMPPPVEDAENAVTSHFLYTHQEGSVALTARYRLPEETKCDFGAAAHVVTRQRYDLYFRFELVRHEGANTVVVYGSAPGWYPDARVQAAGVDTRPITHPFLETFWDTYGLPMGEERTVTTGALEVVLPAGEYSMRTWTNDGLDNGTEDLKGGSLLQGIRCEDAFVQVWSGEDRDPLVLFAWNATGEVDASAGLVAEAHQGSRDWPQTSPSPHACTVSMAQRGQLGTVSLDGPGGFEWQTAPDGTRNVYSNRDVSPGDHVVSWDLAGAQAFAYWTIGAACFDAASPEQTGTDWSPPE